MPPRATPNRATSCPSANTARWPPPPSNEPTSNYGVGLRRPGCSCCSLSGGGTIRGRPERAGSVGWDDWGHSYVRACPKLTFVGHLCRNLCRNLRFFWANSTKAATKVSTKRAKNGVLGQALARACPSSSGFGSFVGNFANFSHSRQRWPTKFPTKESLGQ